MLIYVLRWRPSWISDRHKKQYLGKGHWMFLYNLKVFCSDMKFKMAATAGLSLTLDPMGKMFQNASSLKPLGQSDVVVLFMFSDYVSLRSLFRVVMSITISPSKLCSVRL
jgi:hypothetical protein